VGLGIQTAGIVVALGNPSVEVVLPECGGRLQLPRSGGSVVRRVDPVSGPPDFDFTDEGGARLTACGPDRWRVVSVCVFSEVSGEVSDQLRALCKIATPNGMIMKCFRYAGKPGQRSRVSGGCGFLEAPVQHGGHIFGGVEFSSGGCLQVEEWVFTGFSR